MTKEILTVSEAAEFLHCSKSHMWKIIKNKEIKFTNIALEGRKKQQIRFLRADIVKWVEQKSHCVGNEQDGKK